MERKLLAWTAIIGVLLAVGLSGCTRSVAGKQPEDASGSHEAAAKVKVLTSFYSIAFFASQVGGDRVAVQSLVPAGVEPHDWEPSVEDIKALNTARVFAYNGADFEPWVPKTLESLGNPHLIAVDTSKGLDLIHEGPSNAINPHVWLDPVNAASQVERIEAALVVADPEGKATYEANALALKAKLAEIDGEYQAAVSSLASKDLVVSHAFFAYPARRYGLHEVAVRVSPDSEPTPKQVADVVTYARQHHVTTVFAETLVDDKAMRTVAEQVGARVLTLNPLEGLTEEDSKEGRDFLSILRDNLSRLREGLQAGH